MIKNKIEKRLAKICHKAAKYMNNWDFGASIYDRMCGYLDCLEDNEAISDIEEDYIFNKLVDFLKDRGYYGRETILRRRAESS